MADQRGMSLPQGVDPAAKVLPAITAQGQALPPLSLADQAVVNALAALVLNPFEDSRTGVLRAILELELSRTTERHHWLQPVVAAAREVVAADGIRELRARRLADSGARLKAARALADFFAWRLGEVRDRQGRDHA